MAIVERFTSEGVEVVDELVACTEQVSIGGQTYYRGFLSYIAGAQIAEAGAYGVWAAPAKGGTRYTVLLAGLPGSATEVAIDPIWGHVLATSSIGVYASYLAYGPTPEKGQPVVIATPWQWPTGDPQTVRASVGSFTRVAKVAVSINGQLPSTNTTLTLTNSSNESQTFILRMNSLAYPEQLSGVLKLEPNTLVTLSGDGKNAADITFTLIGI